MREADTRSLWSILDVLINWILMIAARRRQKKTMIQRMTIIRRSYRMGNQIRLPKHRLYIGHAIVGIHVNKSRNDTTAIQIVVFHLPRGANLSVLMDLTAVSIPNINVMYPTMNMAMRVNPGSIHKRLLHTWKCNH
jgi:hypothetical protein